MTANILTANLLVEGSVVYLTSGDDWSTDLSKARLAMDDGEKAVLQAAADRAVGARRIVGPYFIAVTEMNGRIQPVGTREMIRASGGPTITPPGSGAAVED